MNLKDGCSNKGEGGSTSGCARGSDVLEEKEKGPVKEKQWLVGS